MNDRILIKKGMILARTNFRGIQCDLCQQRFTGNMHMHEMIARRRTIGHKEARELSFQPELCSILCPDCHLIAETEIVERLLWLRNFNLYGETRVRRAHKMLTDTYPINHKLPEIVNE